MRHAWLTSIGALLCAAGISAATAEAGPAGMRIASKPHSDSSITRSEADERALAPSTDKVSPWRNPIKYMGAAFSDVSFPSVLKWPKKDDSRLTADPVLANDPISLDEPTGPAKPELFIAMGQMAERSGDVPQARRHYQHALAKWPGNVEVLRAAARMEDRQGQLQLAESLYQQAVSANPQHPGVLNDLGLCLARQGRLEASVAAIERAIHIQPDKALYRNNVATVLVELREDQKALAHLSAVHAPAEANFNMGQLLVGRGRSEEAAMYFQMALQHNPSYTAAQNALAQLQGGAVIAPPSYTVDGSHPVMQLPVDNSPSMSAPQQQLQFPATARSPELGTSTYVAPQYAAPHGYAPGAMYPQTTAPLIGAAPRYLPPVSAPGPGLLR